MASETCPHCGAAADNVRCPGNDNWYACGTMESDPKDRGGKCYRNEIANLRSQNRDLQQAYDHVLECEQNRCREVVELQDRLADLRRRIDEAPFAWMCCDPQGVPMRVAYCLHQPFPESQSYRVRLVRDQPGETDA